MTGLLLVAAAALIPLISGQPGNLAAKVILSAGAIILLAGRILNHYDGKVFRVKRLFAIERWAPIFFCTSAFFMWYSDDPREWIVFLLAGAFIQLYTSIAIPYAANKAAKDEVRKQNESKNDNKHN